MAAPLPPEARSSPLNTAPHPPSEGGGDAVWGRRAVALIVDNLILYVPLIIALVLVYDSEDTATGDEGSVLGGVLVLLYIVLPFAYFTYFHGGERGQTLGKRMLGIAVRSARDQESIGYGKAFLRYLAVVMLGFFFIPIILDYLWPLFDSQNQALHDKMISTIVVRV